MVLLFNTPLLASQQGFFSGANLARWCVKHGGVKAFLDILHCKHFVLDLILKDVLSMFSHVVGICPFIAKGM